MTSRKSVGEERRRHERVGTPGLFISFDGRSFEAGSWSMGGFLVEGYTGRLSAGSLFTVDGIGTGAASMTPVAIRARVVRSDPGSQSLVVSFLDLDDRAYAILQEFMAERMRGLRDPRLA